MKIKKVISALSCAALITAAALPLAACGGKSFKEGTVNLDDYAVEYKSTTEYSHKEVTKAEEKFTGYDVVTTSIMSNYTGVSPFVLSGSIYSSGSVYNVTNIWTGNPIYSNISSSYLTYVHGVRGQDFDVPLLRIQYDDDGETGFEYYGENGDGIYTGTDNPVFSIVKYYVRDESEKSNILTVKSDSGNRYFKVTKEDNQCSYERLSESDIHFIDPSYEEGENAFSPAMPIYSKTGKNVVLGEIANYSIAFVGSDIVFYKGNEETGKVSADNLADDGVAFVGDYMYYVKLEELEEKSKDANLIYAGLPEERYNYEFHRYDIIANKDVKLNYNVKIDYIEPLYNSKEKAYDAVVIHGAKIKNNTYQNGTEFTYIADKDLNVAYDITGSRYNGNFKLYSLDDEHYMLESTSTKTVFNKDMQVVSKFDSSANYLENEKLFSFTGNAGTGYANLDGKVVIDPIYQSVHFYGGVAYATNRATGEKVFLKSDGTEKDAPKANNDTENWDEIIYPNGCGIYYTLGYPAQNTSSSTKDYWQQLNIYNYSGMRLATVRNVQKQAGGYEIIGNFMKLPIVDDKDNTTYTLVYLA